MSATHQFSDVLIALPKKASSAPLSKLLYSRKEVAHLLNLSIRSVDLILSAGQMKVRRIGRRLLVPADSVAQYANRDHRFLTQYPSGTAQ